MENMEKKTWVNCCWLELFFDDNNRKAYFCKLHYTEERHQKADKACHDWKKDV